MDPLPAKEKNVKEPNSKNKPVFEEIIRRLRENGNGIGKYKEPLEFTKKVKLLLNDLNLSTGVLNNVVKSMSRMDKKADIQKDSKGRIVPDKETKDIELIPVKGYMKIPQSVNVLPHVPDAIEFFEEDLNKKTRGKSTPSIKIGAEIPFTRYFYKYEEPKPSEELLIKFKQLEEELNDLLAELG